MQIEILGQELSLLPQKAIYWKNNKTLLISDLHLGKVTHFRKAGIPIPSHAGQTNLDRLTELVITHEVERVILLGDLFHSHYNAEWKAFCAWRNENAKLIIQIALGNHDRYVQKLFQEACLEVHAELQIGNFIFTHHPKDYVQPGLYVFSGHVHPVYNLITPAKHSLRFPCFVFDLQQAILPSFGVFTGGYLIDLIPGRSIYLVAPQEIFKV